MANIVQARVTESISQETCHHEANSSDYTTELASSNTRSGLSCRLCREVEDDSIGVSFGRLVGSGRALADKGLAEPSK